MPERLTEPGAAVAGDWILEKGQPMTMQSTKGLLAGLAMAVLGAACLAGVTPAAAQTRLTVAASGEAYSESQMRALHEPYMAHNPEIFIYAFDDADRALTGLRDQTQAGNVIWDLVDMTPLEAAEACEEGLILPIAHDALLAPAPDGTPPSLDFLPGTLGECFTPTVARTTVMAFDGRRFPIDRRPRDIEDFFDVEAFPGYRAIQSQPAGNLEWALHADGVALERIYAVLRTADGVDRAFAKLDTIKDRLVFWSKPGEPAKLLAERRVAFASGGGDDMLEAAMIANEPIEIIWDVPIVGWQGWVVPALGSRIEEAVAYLSWATDSRRLADEASLGVYAPARASAMALIQPHPDLGIDMRRYMPTLPDSRQKPILLDTAFWSEHGEALDERFARWLKD